jgi:putative nucleotidyltransferase with HDIG domain
MDRIPLLGEVQGSLTQVSAIFGDMNVKVRVWIVALWTAAAVVLLQLALGGPALPPWWVLVGLGAIAALAERQSVPVTRNIETSVSFLPSVFTAVAFGPLAAAIVGATASSTDIRPPYGRWFVYTPARALTGAAAGAVAMQFMQGDSSAFGQILFASLAAALTNLVLDSAFNTVTLAVRGSASPLAFVGNVGPLLALSLPLYVPLVALLVYGYQAYSIWIVATFLLPALALQRLIHLYQEQRDAVSRLGEVNQQLERANLSFASALVATLDARDRYTAGHSAAVAVYSRDIAKRLGLSEEDQQLAHLCGLVHDIGKVGLSPGLLEKGGALTLEERRQMEQHPVIGERILSKVEDYADIARVVRHHHERVDGLGYPDSLHGEEIPVLSRIIAVADAYNAMTSDRPYRDAMPSRVARLRLAQAVESQFDTTVVAAFEAVLASASEMYRSGQREDFSLEIKDAQRTLRVATA